MKPVASVADARSAPTGQAGVEPCRAEHAFQALPRQLQEQGLAVPVGRQHGGAMVEHDHVARPLHGLPAVLNARRQARELEQHHDHPGPVVAPGRAGRRLASQGALRQAREVQRADLRDVEPAPERPVVEALDLDRHEPLPEKVSPKLEAAPGVETLRRKHCLHRQYLKSRPRRSATQRSLNTDRCVSLDTISRSDDPTIPSIPKQLYLNG